MNKKATPLTWQIDVKNKLKSESIGNDFILFEDFSAAPMFMYPFKLNMLILLICERGSVRGTVEMQPYDLSAPFAVIIRPNQVMHYEYISPDFSGHCLIMSNSFASEFLPNIDRQLLIASAIQENPFAQLDKEGLRFIRHYFFLLKKFIAMRDNPYRLGMVKHLTMVFYYWARPHFQVSLETVKQPRQALLAEQFITLVRENYRSERDTAFYAEKLCLTSKYLSQVIKSATGKSASDWIDDYVILEARALLKSTNMTIQQISDALNFPSQSFFGKYFKRIAGVSPREYRRG
ncbi:MAG: helix-turn-helix domain-containing protein [Dysgonamonadaceae bacterium]|jgi:AraC-like DNA-binding protein|nr:helix-turn-helix domain-containing protein [Dysgonamonadaceae bacterium]